MKKFAIRCIASLCVAAGSLALVLPAQAINSGGILCGQSALTTTGNAPFYQDCRGPKDGTLNGSPSEAAEIIALFAPDFSLDSLAYKGKSNDPSSGPFGPNGPFSADPGSNSSGILAFDERVFGLFVVGLQGGLPSIPGGLPSNPNYSYYLFDTGTIGTLSLNFDTDGLVSSNDPARGGPLAFATLYRLQPQGGTVPEPAGIALAAVAFGALALTTRRRRG